MTTRKTLRRFLSVLLTTAALLSLLAVPVASAGEAETFSFGMLINYNSVEPPKDSNMMMQFLRDELGADLKITWIPTTAYDDKLSTQIAAADLPEVVVARTPKGSVIVNAVEGGLFWPIDAYLNNPEYPNLARMNPAIVNNLTIDGNIYALPRMRDIARSGMYFRQDWLDAVGLDIPTTMDEIWEVIKAFTENDPDGNGANDTTGISMKGRNLGDFLSNVAIYYGGMHEWYVDENGEVKNEVDHPAYQKSLNFFREAFANGYILSNLVEVDDEYVPFQTGKAGFVFINALSDVVDAQLKIADLFPEAKVGFTQNITTPDGDVAMRAHIGYTGALMFPRTAIKTEDDLAKVMRFFDLMGSDQNALTMRRGIEGVHYSIVDGNLVTEEAQIAQFREVDFPDADQLTPFGTTKPYPEVLSDPLSQAVQDSMDNYSGTLYPKMTDIYTSSTLTTMGETLTDILKNARMQYVLGELDQAGWEAAVAEWRAAGGDAVAKELTEAYKADQAN